MLKNHLLANLSKLGEAGIYFVFGMLILLIGRVVWNGITKYNANKEIGETDNVAAGIAEFGFLIALSIIILSSVSGEKVAEKVPLYIDLLISLIYSIFGLIALAIGKLILDLSTPFKLDDEIARDRNPAAGWLQAGFYIAISVILFGIL